MDDPVAEIPDIIHTLCTAPPANQRSAIDTYFTPTASFTHPFCRTGSGPWSRWLITQIYRWYKILSPHIDVSVDSVAFDKEKLLLYVSIHQNFRLRVVPFYNAPVKLVTVLRLVKGPSASASTSGKPLNFIEHFFSPNDHQNGKTSEGKADAFENEAAIPNKGKKKVLFTSPPDDRKKPTALPTDNSFSILASPSPSPVLESKGRDERYYIQSQDDLYQTTEWIKFLIPWGIGGLLMAIWQFWATLLCVVGAKTYDFLTDTPRKSYAAFFGLLEKDGKTTLDVN